MLFYSLHTHTLLYCTKRIYRTFIIVFAVVNIFVFKPSFMSPTLYFYTYLYMCLYVNNTPPHMIQKDTLFVSLMRNVSSYVLSDCLFAVSCNRREIGASRLSTQHKGDAQPEHQSAAASGALFRCNFVWSDYAKVGLRCD